MSRVGKVPIAIPDKVEVTLQGMHIKVTGPKGELERELSDVVDVAIGEVEGARGEHVLVTRRDDSRQSRSHQGLVRALVANMVHGVHEGYVRALEINGVGYRAEALKGNFIRFDLGYSHPIFFELPELVEADVKATEVTLRSIDKELIGQVAAKIRSLRKPEPYKGKGIKYKEEVLLRKVGKAGK
ncbi:MAG: 50S ribosomal protein L6 [Myxococcota bacterium]